MASKKKTLVKVKVRKRGRRLHIRRWSPAELAWRTWMHDFDTILHELVKNPAMISQSPAEILAYCEKFADAYRALQERRRPEGVK